MLIIVSAQQSIHLYAYSFQCNVFFSQSNKRLFSRTRARDILIFATTDHNMFLKHCDSSTYIILDKNL